MARRLLDLGYLVLHEGKTFRQYDDHWGSRPRYVVARDRLADRELVLRRATFFRLGYRDIAGPGDKNVSIFNLHPPGITTGHTAPLEHRPYERPNSAALLLLAVLNTLSFDWLLQLRVRSHLNQFMLLATPLPMGIWRGPGKNSFAHGALRLTCNHAGYAPLWREQMGEVWRESTSPGTWPVLASEDERWAVRAAIDAIVADAYGLRREQYTFRHGSYPKAPDLCLQRLDELKAIGLGAFAKKYDPYWDIPLNENPPQPVIELPIPAGEGLREPQGDLYPSDQEGVPLRRVAEAAPEYGRARGKGAGRGSSRGGGRARRR